MTEFLKVCRIIKDRGGSDIHLAADQPVFYRANGIITKLDKVVFTEDAIKKIILKTSSAKAREILGKQRQVTYAETVENFGRLRFSVFVDKGHFALAVRILRDNFFELKELGFGEGIRKILSQQSGLILVGSPSCEGKSSTIAACLNFINRHFEKSVFTIENPVEFVYEDNRSTFIQRSIPVDTSNFYNGLCEAARVDPDVVVSDSLNYSDAMDQALSLCESGCLVIGATEGGDSQQIIERLVNSRQESERDALRNQIASHLKLIISQRLVPCADFSGRQAIFDILINIVQVKALIRNNSMSMLRTLQAQGEADGMKTFDSQLMDMRRKRLIEQETAVEFAVDKSKFVNKRL